MKSVLGLAHSAITPPIGEAIAARVIVMASSNSWDRLTSNHGSNLVVISGYWMRRLARFMRLSPATTIPASANTRRVGRTRKR